jgi:ribosomal subunit interface protein
MLITVAGKQVDTGDALKTHVSDSLDTIARKYFDHAIEANVTFRRDHKGKLGAFFACDINLKAGRNLFIRSEGEGPDAHRAFEEAAEHLAKRLRRYRRRMSDHARDLAEERREPEVARQYVLQPVPDEEEAEQPVNGTSARPDGADHGAIVAETPTQIERLSVGEAAMRMDLADLPVLMFRNRATDTLNVVYRRPDGNVGWIDPSGG